MQKKTNEWTGDVPSHRPHISLITAKIRHLMYATQTSVDASSTGPCHQSSNCGLNKFAKYSRTPLIITHKESSDGCHSSPNLLPWKQIESVYHKWRLDYIFSHILYIAILMYMLLLFMNYLEVVELTKALFRQILREFYAWRHFPSVSAKHRPMAQAIQN